MTFEQYCAHCLALQLTYIRSQRTLMRELEAVRARLGVSAIRYKAAAKNIGFHTLTGPEIAARLIELDAMEADAPRAFGDTPGMRILFEFQCRKAAA